MEKHIGNNQKHHMIITQRLSQQNIKHYFVKSGIVKKKKSVIGKF